MNPRLFQRRPRYADVAATLALVMSTAGTSYAAATITTTSIKDGTIQSRDIATGGVRGVDVADGTLGLADINDTAEAALRGQDGPQGPQGEKGDPGTALGYAYVVTDENVPFDWRSNLTEDNVTQGEPSAGGYTAYCFHDLPFTVDNIQVTPQSGDARVSRGGIGCPDATQAVVETQGTAFWVLFN